MRILSPKRALLAAPLVAVGLLALGAPLAQAAPSNLYCDRWAGTSALPPGTKPGPGADIGVGPVLSAGAPAYAGGGACAEYRNVGGASYNLGTGSEVGVSTAGYGGTTAIVTGSAGYSHSDGSYLTVVGAAVGGPCKGGRATVGAVYTDATGQDVYQCV